MDNSKAWGEMIMECERLKEDASQKAPQGMRLWEMAPTLKWAQRTVKHYGFTVNAIVPMHGGFAVYYAK